MAATTDLAGIKGSPWQVTITTNADTPIAVIPTGKQGATVKLSGTIGGTTMTLAYADEDDNVFPYNSVDASITAAGEISVFAGEGDKLYLTTAGGAAADILAVVTVW
ncbi:MAG: hypothetical protein V3W52_17255 [Syntrophobacteria bacterium]